MSKKKISRREFLAQSALIGAGTVGAMSMGGLLTSCGDDSKNKKTPLESAIAPYYPELGDKALDGKPLKAGIIGCGSRGGGAAFNFLDSGDGLSIVTMADIFEDRLEDLRKRLKERQGTDIPDNKIYYGFDAYKKVCEDPEIDLVLIATPSVFHAPHTKYAVECGKHVFCEKPAGIDPVGCRTMLAAIKQARDKNLVIMTGTQRHHNRDYNECYRRIREGEIGRITNAVVKWNQGHMGYRDRQPGWTDMEYMLRDFFSWNWLCGDHVIDQLVHNVDVFQWFSHLKPVSVVAMGSQLQRKTGDIYDNFCLDLLYEGNVRVNAQARQIDDCANDVSETIYGTEGYWTSKDMSIRDLNDNIIWKYDYDAQNAKYKQNDPYVLEHMDMVNQIRSGNIVPQAETTVISSLTCAMARESAYTGKELKYDEFMTSDLSLMLPELHLDNIEDFEKKFVAPKAGQAPPPNNKA